MNRLADRPHTMSLLRSALVALALGVGGFSILAVSYDAHRVQSPSMAPTVQQGDLGLFKTVSSGGDIGRGDIVRFKDPWPEAKGFDEIVFRVVAVGGDVIACCKDGKFVLNGKVLREKFAIGQLEQEPNFSVRVPAGRVFLMGDSRSLANDSRQHLNFDDGTVSSSAISARLVGVSWPAWHWHKPNAKFAGFIGTSVASIHGPPFAFLMGSALIALALVIMIVVLFKAIAWTRGQPSSDDPGIISPGSAALPRS